MSRKKLFRRMCSILLVISMMFGLSAAGFASIAAELPAVPSEEADSAISSASVQTEYSAPPIRWRLHGANTWHYAEEIPLYNSHEATLYFDKSDSTTLILPEGANIDSVNKGTLTQIKADSTGSDSYAATEDLSGVSLTGDVKETIDKKVLTYTSARLQANTAIVGYPEARLYLNSAAEGEVTVLLEAVNATNGASTVIAKGTASVTSGEQLVSVTLNRAYDDGQGEQPTFVAYRAPSTASLRVSVFTSKGTSITLYTGGEKPSSIDIPVMENDENGYNGKITIDGNTYSATMYWLVDRIYVNYSKSEQNDSWISIPSDTPYTVLPDNSADFGVFKFIQIQTSAVTNATEQRYNAPANAVNQFPFPAYRHAVVAEVPLQAVPDLLYLPTVKTLKYDVFMPTGEHYGEKNVPLIIYVHGFGGSYSNIGVSSFLLSMLDEGYAVAGITARPYPPNFAPDYYQDIKGNIRHLRANAAKYGINPDRFGIFGESFGGNTALMALVSGDDPYIEGNVGGNLEYSSRLQAGIAGYGWTDMIYFGADQREDDPAAMARYYSGGDGENTPIAQAIDFYGPGKGLLVVRNYIEERNAAKAEGPAALEAFLAKDYSFTIDDDYLIKHFPLLGTYNDKTGEWTWNLGTTVTKGEYSHSHELMKRVIERAKAASPLYYITPDDPPIGMFAGLGGGQMITNNQSTRTLQRLNDFGVEGFMWGNTLGNYGREPEIVAAMKNYFNEYLMEGPKGVRIALTVGKSKSVVNYVSDDLTNELLYQDDAFLIPLAYVADKLGTDISGVTTSTPGVTSIDGVLYATSAAVRTLTRATVNEYQWVDLWGTTQRAVVIYKADAVLPTTPASPVLSSVERSSTYTSYTGYSEPIAEYVYVNREYVEVPAVYEGIRSSFKNTPFESVYTDSYDPDIPDDTFDTINLAVGYVLPSADSGVKPGTRTTRTGGTYIEGKYPVVVAVSRSEIMGNNPLDYNIGQYLATYGYAYVLIETRGSGSSEGIFDSFASREYRRDVAYIMENWLAEQPWSNGKYAMIGGSNRGLIQTATATMQPEGLLGLMPRVANPDYYYQNYPNGVSSVPFTTGGYNRTGLDGDTFVPSPNISDPEIRAMYTYEAFINGTAPFTRQYDGLVPVSTDEKDLQILYNAWLTQRYSRNFMQWLHPVAVLRDQTLPYLGDEPSNMWTPVGGSATEGTDSITAGNYEFFNIAGLFDPGASSLIASANLWNGKTVMLNTGHGADVAPEIYLRYLDYLLKGIDNGYDEAPPFYYEVVNKSLDPASGTLTPTLNARYADSFPLESSNDSILYLTTEEENINVSAALKLNGPQSNNGKLTPSVPAVTGVTEYTVDMDVGVVDTGPTGNKIFMGDSNLGFNMTREMSQYVDARSLTFTSAPLAADTEIVGIPTIDLWVSSDNSNDVDIIAFLEYVTPTGESFYLSRAVLEASHRKTGENALWDSTKGLRGRYHTSLTADVEAARAEGLKDPVLLQFNFAMVSHKIPAGASLRVSIACAYEGVYQHPMYYDDATGAPHDRTGLKDELPTIKLYTGGDKLSQISLPVVERSLNTINGTVTFMDGSYTGPGTMYLFEENWYLYVTELGKWKKLPVGSSLQSYTVENNAAVFANAGFSFLPEGSFIANGVVQNYMGGGRNTTPFPTKYQLYVDTVPIQTVPDLLYLPTTKDLYIDLFMPEGTTSDSSVPLIIFIHGYGGSTLGIDNFLVDRIAEGYAVAGVDLRNYPSNFSPDHYHDVKGGIRYLRAHALELGIDPGRFAVYGESLGGNSALMAALTGGKSEQDQYMEGTVGGNLDISSRVQAGIIGYGWSDLLNFGADARADHANVPNLYKNQIANDGEKAPAAQVIDFYGPGKGLLVLRNFYEQHYEAGVAARNAGGQTWEDFRNQIYTLVIDDAYIDKYFAENPSQATKGTYEYTYGYLMDKIEDAFAASPLYYVSADDPVLFLYGGFGGTQMITNNQTVRTFRALNALGVKAFYAGNTNGNYGREESVRAAMITYLQNYLMNRSAKTYTITATAGAGGSISPSGTSVLIEGSSKTYIITPDSGYKISSVTVDGVNMGAISSYTFTNISANHTIAASFEIIRKDDYSEPSTPSVYNFIGNGTISIPATVSGGTATLTISDNTLNRLLGAAKEDGVLRLDASGLSGVTSIVIPAVAFQSIASSAGSGSGQIGGLEIIFKGATLKLDADAILAIASQGTSSDLRIRFAEIAPSALNSAQADMAGDRPVFDIQIILGGREITSLGGGKLTVTIPYTLQSGEEDKYLVIWYLASDGTVEPIPCTYSNGKITFTLDHLSQYALAYFPFDDVDAGKWYYGNVAYAYMNGLMNGVGNNRFAPEEATTRAMVVTILWRLEGSPSAAAHSFTDVKSGEWYTNAISWAAEKGIVQGYGGGLFGPEDKITREQMAVILMNYARFKGYNVSASNSLDSFIDKDSISSWAVDAMKWANAEGIINGVGNNMLNPSGDAQRAQVAAILQRFIQGR